MNLVFHNLGQLKGRQVIDLTKRFYVFMGVNNSGKTYTAQLLWAVLNRNYIDEFARNYKKLDIYEPLSEVIVAKIVNDYFTYLIESKLPMVFNTNDTTFFEHFSLALEYDENTIFESYFSVGTFNDAEDKYKQRGEKFYEGGVEKMRGSWLITFSNFNLIDNLNLHSIEPLNEFHKNYVKTITIKQILSLLLDNTAITTPRYKIFIPANRHFYAPFYKYIMEYERENNNRIREAIELGVTNGDLKKLAQHSYTEPISDLIKQIYSLNTNATPKHIYNNLLLQLEDVMGGSIEMRKIEAIAMLDWVFVTNDKKELPMYLASSSVNQLSLLYFYLKYWVQNSNNFLMIDEPEENLNPRNQFKLLDVLLRFASQSENKVLITTHSPLITDAVNTYLYLNKLQNEHGLDKKTLIEQHNLQNVSADIDLSPADLGVYFFNGTQIIDYGNDNYGVYFRDFKNVTDSIAQNNRTLTDLLYQKENEDE